LIRKLFFWCLQNGILRRDQDGRIEGLELNFSSKNNKIHNLRLSTLHPNELETIKRYPTPEEKEEATSRCRRGNFTI